MNYDPTNPFIIQGDRTVLVEVDNPKYAQARDSLAPFAELEKSPEHVHTYRLTPLSLWNAAAAGMTADAMVEVLGAYSKFPLPTNLPVDIRELVSRYGRVRLIRADGVLRLVAADRALLEELARQKGVRDYLGERIDEHARALKALLAGVSPGDTLVWTAALGLCLLVSVLFQGGKLLERHRSQYGALLRQAQELKQEIRLYNDKAAAAQKLVDTYKLDPMKLRKATEVAEASAAIQKAIASSGVGVGPVRESSARPANKELATVQVECTGPVPSVTGMLKRLETVGYPLIIQNVQLTPLPNPPGQMKVNLTIVILDFEQWKKEGSPNA